MAKNDQPLVDFRGQGREDERDVIRPEGVRMYTKWTAMLAVVGLAFAWFAVEWLIWLLADAK